MKQPDWKYAMTADTANTHDWCEDLFNLVCNDLVQQDKVKDKQY